LRPPPGALPFAFMKNLSVVESHRERRAKPSIPLIDVRTPAEFRSVHAEGALNHPLESLEAEALPFEKSETLHLICQSGGRSAKVSETLCALSDDFVVLSGDDGLTLPFMACGAKGVISVASNLIPSVVVEMVGQALGSEYESARRIHLANYKLFNDLFCEPNPVPVKTLMQLKGLLSSAEVRLPLTPPSKENFGLLAGIADSLNL